MIRNMYRYQLFIDDLPNATMDRGYANYKEGIYVGKYNTDGSTILYNHLELVIKTHHVSGGDEVRIVGFEVTPYSIEHGSSLDS